MKITITCTETGNDELVNFNHAELARWLIERAAEITQFAQDTDDRVIRDVNGNVVGEIAFVIGSESHG